MLAENCYVVSDETNQCAIIDCGAYYEQDRNAIGRYIADNTLTPCHLLVTHGHLDHNFGNPFVYERYQLRPEVSQRDERLMQTLAKQAQSFYNITIEDNFPAVGHFLEDDEVIAVGNHQF